MDCRRRTQSSRISRPSSKPKYNRRTKRISNTKQRHHLHQRKPLHSHPIRAPKNHLARRRKRRRTHRNRPQRLRFALSGRRCARRMAAECRRPRSRNPRPQPTERQRNRPTFRRPRNRHPHCPDRIRRHHPKHTGIRPTIRRINKQRGTQNHSCR